VTSAERFRGQPVHPARGRSNLSWQVSGWPDRSDFHSCGGSAGLERFARTGFPIITRPCDPDDHDTPHLVVVHVSLVNRQILPHNEFSPNQGYKDFFISRLTPGRRSGIVGSSKVPARG